MAFEEKHSPGAQEHADENALLGSIGLFLVWLGIGAAEIGVGAYIGGPAGASVGGVIYLIETGVGVYLLAKQ